MRLRILGLLVICCGLTGILGTPARAQSKPAKPAKPAAAKPPEPHYDVVVAQGESFKPLDDKGWKPTVQDDSYASHTYGGMWVVNGALLGAPAASEGSVATRAVQVPANGDYRVWSKYQAPPYFNYLHQIEIVQNGKTVFSHVYGKSGTDRFWSFSARSTELWWPWGVDHDAAESPSDTAKLAAGPAEIRLTSLANPAPAGDRFIDFVLLTTNPDDSYKGYPGGVGSPFCLEALAANNLYVRFKLTADGPGKVSLSQPTGHFQPRYRGSKTTIANELVPPGQWSPWFNIGPYAMLVHNEGLVVRAFTETTNPKGVKAVAELPVTSIALQFARDPEGKDSAGDVQVSQGDAVNIPIDIIWNKQSVARPSKEIAREIIAQARGKWRTANGGNKPREIAYYGAFQGGGWVHDFEDALGYNTLLPDSYKHLEVDGYHQHTLSPAAIEKFAETVGDKSRMRVLSFGDEIHIGSINFNDPAMQEAFVAWLKAKGITAADLGMEPDAAKLADRAANPRVGWYANRFSDEQRFAYYRNMTALAKKLIGPQVQTGANYSPHGQPQYYGPLNQWVDIFKHNGMTMYWAEDYIFSVAQVPQMISWMFATMHCATKYNHQLIHFYVMPHAPGQTAGNLRRSMVYAIGAGAAHIDNFWVAPQENWTENYVAWNYPDMFRVIHESIFDSGEVEKISLHGTRRAGRVAVLLSRATDFNEGRLRVDAGLDPFVARCANAMKPKKAKDGTVIPPTTAQIICRVDQQMLYLALKHAQQNPQLITEDDVNDGILKDFDVVYFAGEWIDHRAVRQLDAWVKEGGVLYAAAGTGHLNEFNEPEPTMLKLLGLKSSSVQKDLYIIRPLLELPLVKPIDTITLDGRKIPAVGMKQQLVPDGAKVLGTWSDGSAAVTVNEYGKGKAFAVGTLAGSSYMKTGLRVAPFARGGGHTVYNPTEFDPAATRLARLGLEAAPQRPEVECSVPLVESSVIDAKEATLLTLTNWTNSPIKELKVSIRMPAMPKSVRSVEQQRAIAVTYADGVATFIAPLNEADYFVLER
ncbi:MAG: beta-galactosidase trimerization domain-containing protein [Planctomycetes bacterium]|nr:beta-galactosidase trimerization domain-containing protein [Planctomycetota bacterium]